MAEENLINQFYNDIVEKLEKGYIVTLVPREPTEAEYELNNMHQHKLKKIGEGIVAGHSYAILSANTFVGNGGTRTHVIKLRNSFYGE